MLKIFSSTALKSSLPSLLSDFEVQQKISSKVEFGTSNQITDRLLQGESADLLILTREAIKDLITAGFCEADSLKDLCQTSIGVAIHSDAEAPLISTPTHLIDTIKKAKSITFTSKGASGIYFKNLLERLGLLNEVLPKAIIPEGGLVAELVTQNKAEVAIQLISEIKAVPTGKTFRPSTKGT
jgi:molybdate transport system substrate-binding protein